MDLKNAIMIKNYATVSVIGGRDWDRNGLQR